MVIAILGFCSIRIIAEFCISSSIAVFCIGIPSLQLYSTHMYNIQNKHCIYSVSVSRVSVAEKIEDDRENVGAFLALLRTLMTMMMMDKKIMMMMVGGF